MDCIDLNQYSAFNITFVTKLNLAIMVCTICGIKSKYIALTNHCYRQLRHTQKKNLSDDLCDFKVKFLITKFMKKQSTSQGDYIHNRSHK